MNKKCSSCEKEKSFDDFHNNKRSKDGKTNRCKPCAKEYNLEWQARDPERARESWKKSEAKTRDNLRSRARKYGLTKAELQLLLEKANNKCEICGRPPYRWLVVDHCHNSFIVRGILCEACNQAIGLMQDNVESLASAIKYLNKNKI